MARLVTPWRVMLLMLLSSLALSCTNPSPREARARGGERGGGPAESALVFEPAELQLGRVVPGGFADGIARVRNTGDRPLEVVRYSAPCECTSAEPELPRTLGANESFSFPVRLDLSRLLRGGLSEELGQEPQELRRTLSLWTSDGRSLELPVLVEISQELQIEPVVVNLQKIERGSKETATVLLSPGRSRQGKALGLLSVKPEPGSVPVEVSERRSGQAVELELTVGPFPDAGPYESALSVLTDAEPGPVRLLIRGEVLEPLLVVPESINAPAADPTHPIVVKVHVRRRDGGPIALLDSRSTSGRIKISPLGESENGAQVLRLLIAVRPWPEEVRGEVLLETDFPGEAGRLTVPVFVKARPPR